MDACVGCCGVEQAPSRSSRAVVRGVAWRRERPTRERSTGHTPRHDVAAARPTADSECSAASSASTSALTASRSVARPEPWRLALIPGAARGTMAVSWRSEKTRDLAGRGGWLRHPISGLEAAEGSSKKEGREIGPVLCRTQYTMVRTTDTTMATPISAEQVCHRRYLPTSPTGRDCKALANTTTISAISALCPRRMGVFGIPPAPALTRPDQVSAAQRQMGHFIIILQC